MRELQCGVLVVGGGAAGTRAAYEAKRAHPELEVCLAVTGRYETAAAPIWWPRRLWASTRPSTVRGIGDDPEIYLEDTLQTGGGLGDSALCWVLAHEAADRVRELAELGVPFAHRGGHLEQQKLSGCTRARSLTCGGSTGRQITAASSRPRWHRAFACWSRCPYWGSAGRKTAVSAAPGVGMRLVRCESAPGRSSWPPGRREHFFRQRHAADPDRRRLGYGL